MTKNREVWSRAVPYEEQHDNAALMAAIQRGEREEVPVDAPAELGQVIGDCWRQDAATRATAEQCAARLGESVSLRRSAVKK
jgi:hypothetical protein